MPFEFTPQPLKGVVLIKPRVFGDPRGFFLESYRRSEFEAAGIRDAFVQDNCSVSSRGVLRGLHYQLPPRAQGKLVWVPRGSVWDVCVDLRKTSETFGRWLGVTLSEENHLMLYVPPGFGHGFVVLSDSAHFLYKCTKEYDPSGERGVRWDGPDLAIDWPIRDVTVSTKDAALPRLPEAQLRVASPVIWLVGGGGMLGNEVKSLLECRPLEFFATDAETDITVEADVSRIAEARRPSWIVNCAAYTAVDRAEAEEARAHAVNALGPKHLARAARDLGAGLIHISTDYVFSGRRVGPYPEDAPADPIGAYGRSKAAGEGFVREGCPRHFIVRTAWLHGPHGGNFVATMLRLMGERPELRVVDDQHGCPTYAADLADALLAFVAADSQAFGTYHYTNEGACTWHDFATEIQSQALACGFLKARVPIRPIPTSGYPTPAARPANSVLSKERIRATLGLSIPSWQDGLARHLGRLRGR